MRPIRFINLTVLSLSFFFNSFFFAPGAIAQTQASYEEQIAAFASKLKVAQGTQDDLSQRAACLSQRDAALTAQRSDSEVALGNLLRREEVLKQNITQQTAAYDGFKRTFEDQRDTVSRLNRELRYLQDQHEAQEAWIRKCEEEKPWEHLWGLACRFDMDASKVLGLIHSYEGDIATAARYEKIARDSMEASKAELDASQQKLSENQQQAGEIRKAITATEASIASVSKVLADIREVIQPFRKAIDTFAITLTDAKGVDPAAAQSRTLNYLSFLSSQIDDAAASSAKAVSQSNQTLGENWVKACPVQH